ncbi:MAG: bifunctional riboflavin kinase/FAD synthetase [Flavobacteriales bacterium Tduv]
MEIYPSIDSFSPVSYTVFTLGVFDGVHSGHRRLITRLNQKAKEMQSSSVLLSFDPHPREVLQSGFDLKYLTTSGERIRFLKATGLQHLIFHPFTEAFSGLGSEDFVRDFLLSRLRMKHLIVGYDHHIGKGRGGSYRKLKELSVVYGFGIERLPAYEINNQAISSTAIRRALLTGELSWANQALGYAYMISGRVIQGDRLGRELGFPTANIEVDPKKLLPPRGVYAVRVDARGRKYVGMLNIGVRPTLGGLDTRVVEVNLLDFREMIYDEIIYLFLIQRVREERKFDSLKSLKAQLQNDEKTVRSFFS